MRLLVLGQKGNGPTLERIVTYEGFVRGWGPYASVLWNNARNKTFEIEGHLIRVVLVP